MSIECGECERDLRGDHDEACSRHPNNLIPKLQADLSEARQESAGRKLILQWALEWYSKYVHTSNKPSWVIAAENEMIPTPGGGHAD